MPNIDHGASVHPFSLADMQFREIPGAGASTEVTVLTVLGSILAGQSLSTEVDGVVVSVPFNTDTNTTVADLATAIQAQASVATAVPVGNAITITAAAVNSPLRVKNGVVTSPLLDVEAIVYSEITTVASSVDATSEIEVVAYARAGIMTDQREWQIKKLRYAAGPTIIGTDFAVYPPIQQDRSDYLFSYEGVAQVQEIVFSRGATLLVGNTITLNVNGTPINQAFVTSHQDTLDALATQLQALGSIASATRRGDYVIEVVAATNGLPVLLNKADVTGGSLTTRIEIRETKHGQPSAAFLNFGN